MPVHSSPHPQRHSSPQRRPPRRPPLILKTDDQRHRATRPTSAATSSAAAAAHTLVNAGGLSGVDMLRAAREPSPFDAGVSSTLEGDRRVRTSLSPLPPPAVADDDDARNAESPPPRPRGRKTASSVLSVRPRASSSVAPAKKEVATVKRERGRQVIAQEAPKTISVNDLFGFSGSLAVSSRAKRPSAGTLPSSPPSSQAGPTSTPRPRLRPPTPPPPPEPIHLDSLLSTPSSGRGGGEDDLDLDAEDAAIARIMRAGGQKKKEGSQPPSRVLAAKKERSPSASAAAKRDSKRTKAKTEADRKGKTKTTETKPTPTSSARKRRRSLASSSPLTVSSDHGEDLTDPIKEDFSDEEDPPLKKKRPKPKARTTRTVEETEGDVMKTPTGRVTRYGSAVTRSKALSQIRKTSPKTINPRTSKSTARHRRAQPSPFSPRSTPILDIIEVAPPPKAAHPLSSLELTPSPPTQQPASQVSSGADSVHLYD